MTTLIIINGLFAIVILVATGFAKAFYPKEINSVFGYRSARSMKSKEAWLFANRYSANLLFAYGLTTVAIQVVLYMLTDPKVAVLSACVVIVLLLIMSMIQTERKLRQTGF